MALVIFKLGEAKANSTSKKGFFALKPHQGVRSRWGVGNEHKTLVRAEAQAQLYGDLMAALGVIQDHTLKNAIEARALRAGFEKAFIRYAKRLVAEVAEKMPAVDAEGCLDRLRIEVIPAVLSEIEPEQKQLPHTLSDDIQALAGDWECWLDKAYTGYAAHCLAGELSKIEALQFRFQYTFRLRRPEYRDEFVSNLSAALESSLIELEAGIRKRLPGRRSKPSEKGRRRGFPPNTAEHAAVVSIIQRFGSEWREHMPEICAALEGVIPLPKQFTAEEFRNWSEVAEALPDHPQLREVVRTYLTYRLRRNKV